MKDDRFLPSCALWIVALVVLILGLMLGYGLSRRAERAEAEARRLAAVAKQKHDNDTYTALAREASRIMRENPITGLSAEDLDEIDRRHTKALNEMLKERR